MTTKMISKMVTDRKKTASSLEGALTTHTSKATEELHRMLDPHLEEGDVVPDLGMLRRLLGRRLAALRAELVDADEQHQEEQRGGRALRQIRDEATLELVGIISRLRLIVDKSCNQEVFKGHLGVEGTLGRDPVVIQSVAHRVVKELHKCSAQLEVSTHRGVTLDLSAWVEDIEEQLALLDDALKRLGGDIHETFGARLAKSEAMAEYDRSYKATARILEDFFRYVGMTSWSDHVRPSSRSGISTSSEDEPTDTDGTAMPPDQQTPSQAVLAEQKGEETTVEPRAAPAFSLKEVLSS